MEQKRILWIVGAVGIFLLVVIGAALILSNPPKNNNPAIASIQPQNDIWLNPKTVSLGDNKQTSSPVASNSTTEAAKPAAITPPAGTPDAASPPLSQGTLNTKDLTVISNSTTVFTTDGVTTIDLIEQRPASAPPSTEPVQDIKTVVPVTTRTPAASFDENPVEKKSTASTAPAAARASASASASRPVSAKPEAIAAASVKTAPAKPASAAKSAAAKSASVKTAAAKPLPDQFWVQAASFKGKTNAELARNSLADEKIPAEVFTYKDAKGTTFFRLRVGPYTTKAEAEYWNTRIKLIDEFSATKSYVTNTSKPIK